MKTYRDSALAYLFDLKKRGKGEMGKRGLSPLLPLLLFLWVLL
jgi:hypothetical protein